MPIVGYYMAVGGGDAFSLPATLLTVILLWSFLQWSAPLWLPGMSEKYPDKAKFLRQFDRSLTILPVVLVLLVVLALFRAHFVQDFTHGHVVNFGIDNSSSWQRMLHGPVNTVGSPWLGIIILFSITTLVKECFGNSDYSLFDEHTADLRARVLRWHGFLWPLMLIGFIPSDAFSVYSESQTFIGSQIAPLQTSITLIFAGIGMGIWPYAVANYSQSGDMKKGDNFLLASITAVLALFFLAMENLSSQRVDEFDELIALGQMTELALTMSMVVLLLGWPIFLMLLSKVHEKRGIAKERRWLGLTRTLSHTLILIWLSGVVILESLPHIDGWYNSFWLSLTLMLPLAIFGVAGTLLPIVGLDSRPRPEVWGFFLVMSLAIPFLIIREPLTVVLMPGLFISMTTLPLLATHLELRPNLPIQTRVMESGVLIGLTITALWGFHHMFTGDSLAISLGIGITLILPLISILSLNRKIAVS